MKNKTITHEHFDYVNKIVIILGFNNLGDFNKMVSYGALKSSHKTICDEVNKTLDNFKSIYPQNEFNLRKHNYAFENIDQVIGFVKKLFAYLNIPWQYNRVKGEFNMRDIPQNTSNTYLVIHAPKETYNDWKKSNVCLGECVYNNVEQKKNCVHRLPR